MVTTPLSTTTTTQEPSTSWSQLFQKLANVGHPLAQLVKDTLEQKIAEALLPIIIEEVTDESLTLSYQGSINTQNIVPKLPGIGQFFEKLDLSGHLPYINNPIITIHNYDSNNPSFAIEIPELTTTALQPILEELGLETITSGDTFALSLSAEEVQITSLSPLSLTETLKIVPQVKDYVNSLNLPTLNIEEPSIKIIAPTSEDPQYHYQVSVASLPINEFSTWLRGYIADNIPENVKQKFDELAQKVENVDLEIGEDSVKVTYLENLNITNLINSLGLGSISAQLTVENPSLFIQNKGEGEPKYYEVSLSQIPTGEIAKLLAGFTHINILNDLGSLGALDLNISSDEVQLSYGDAVDIVKILDYFADKIQPFNLPSSFTHKAEEFDLTLVKGSSDFNFSAVFTTVTPMAFLTAFGLDAPNFIDEILGDNAAFQFQIEKSGTDENIQIDYIGGVDIGGVIGELASSLGYDNFDTSFGIYNPSILIETTGNTSEYTLKIPEISPKQAVDLFVQLGTFGTLNAEAINTITSELEAVGNAELVLKKDEMSLHFLDNIEFDLGGMFSFHGTVPLIDSAIDRVVDEFIGGNNGDSVLEKTKVSLLKQKQETVLGLSGALNEQEFDFIVTKDDVVFAYNAAQDLDLASIASGIPILQDFTLFGVRVIVMNGTEYTIEYDDFGEIQLHEGVHLLGELDFTQQDDGISNFIDNTLGIEQVDVHLGLKSSGLASLHGTIDGNITVLNIGDFEVTANQLLLGLNIDQTLELNFQIGGDFTLRGYDPIQGYEPALNLAGVIKLEPESITTYVNADWQDGGWINPFGLQGATVRQLAFQGGANPVSGFDNFGFIWDLKYGEIDVELGLSLDVTDPNKYAFIFTPNEVISIANLISSSVIPMMAKQLPDFGQDNVLDKAIDFIDQIFDLKLTAIDSDNDGDLDPLIQYVPFAVDIAGEVLEEGFGVNGEINAWGQTARLYLNADTGITDISGGLSIPEIDLEVLKITGVGDDDLSLELEASLFEQYFRGDGQIEILGQTIGKADFEIGLTHATIKDFSLGLGGVLSVNVPSLKVSLDSPSASGNANLVLFGQNIASGSFNLDKTKAEIKNVNLGFGDYLGLTGANLTIDLNTLTLSGSGNLTIAGINVGDADINVSSEGININSSWGVDIDKIGYLGLGLSINLASNFNDSSVGIQTNVPGLGDLGFSLAVGDFSSGNIALKVTEAVALGLPTYLYNLLKDGVTELYNIVSDAVEAAFDAATEFLEDVVRSIFGGQSDPINYQGDNNNNNKDGNDNKDNLFGLGGNDTLHGRIDNDLIDGGSGNDRLLGGNGHDTIYGGTGNDTILGQNWTDDLYGGPGNDFINGDGDSNETKAGGSDRISGGSGHDTLYGGYGNDTIYGESDNDLIYGFHPSKTYAGPDAYDNYDNDKLDGGAGHDTIYGQAGNDRIYGKDGDDQLIGGSGGQPSNSGDDTIYGGAGNDKIWGQDGNDSLLGDSGNDTLDGGDGDATNTGNDTLEGGSGNDVLYGRDGDDRLIGGTLGDSNNSGADTIDGGAGNDKIWGQDGNDSLLGESGNDTLDGGDGNDTLKGGSGNDILYGGLGNDSLDGGSDNDTLYGNNGDDTLSGGSGNDSLYGGSGNDNLYGSNGNDTLSGETGSDILGGGSGNDILDGGDGDDSLNGGYDNDTLYGKDGNDTLKGSLGNDNLDGGDGNDSLDGESGDDTLYGGQGDDTLEGGSGQNTLVGGLGNDVYHVVFNYTGNTSTIIEDANGGIDTVYAYTSYTLALNVENLTLDSSDPSFSRTGIGNNSDNLLIGLTGRFSLDGKEGNDHLIGNSSSDTLIGGLGSDTLEGGDGDDHYYIDGDDLIIESAGGGTNDTVYTSYNYIIGTIKNIENLVLLDNSNAIQGIGNNLNNSITGNHFNNFLSGGAGNDTLDGSVGNDTLNGGTGNDIYYVDSSGDVTIDESGIDEVIASVSYTIGHGIEKLTLVNNGTQRIDGTGNELDNTILGGLGNNVLYGQGGNDTLDGGGGYDTLYGGDGNDSLIGYGDTLYGGAGNDTLDGGDSSYSSDFLDGGADDDVLRGNAGNDSLYGGEGNDSLYGGTGSDTLNGGAGDDHYYVYGDTTDTIADESGIDTIYVTALNYTLSQNIENLILSDYTLYWNATQTGTGNTLNNTIVGTKLANKLYGEAGNDTLEGGEGNDNLEGGEGNDILKGGSGNDTLSGGSGSNIYDGGTGLDVVRFDYKKEDYEYLTVSKETFVLKKENETHTLYDVEILEFADGFFNLNLETLPIIGTIYNDSLIGSKGDDVIEGFWGRDTLDGREGNDHLFGGANDDRLDGGRGNDTLEGGSGWDTYYVDSSGDIVIDSDGRGLIYSSVTYNNHLSNLSFTLIGTDPINGIGNDRADYIDGNNANNQIFGGGGNDQLRGYGGNDTLNGGEGNDEIYGADGNDLLDGGIGDDKLYGNDGNDYINGNDGNDDIIGGSGNDTMAGGTGDDVYDVDSSGDVIIEQSGQGVDWVHTDINYYTLGSNLENLRISGSATHGYGNSYDNFIYGNNSNNYLSGGAGNDTLYGSSGPYSSFRSDDTLYGGTGNDAYYVDSSDDVIYDYAGEGVDTVYSSIDYTLGYSGNTYLENLYLTGRSGYGYGNSWHNYMYAIGGSKDAHWATKYLYGYAGNDYLDGSMSLAKTLLDGGDGNDTLDGGELYDTLDGGSGDDSLNGGDGNDSLSGGDGHDRLAGGTGNDTMLGGYGNDVYYVDSSYDSITEYSGQGTDTVYSYISSYTLGSNIENLYLYGSAYSGYGNSENNYIYGNSYNNYLSSSSGNDYLNGGYGNDTLHGGSGNDTMYGGTGNDVYYVDSSYDSITEYSGQGTDAVYSYISSYTLGSNVENLYLYGSAYNGYGNSENNTIYGNSYNNILNGYAGNDYLYGDNGDDNLFGNYGNDYLYGGTGKDTLYGEIDNDVLYGGDNEDVLNGGSGNDTLYGASGNDTLEGWNDNDYLNGGTGNDLLDGMQGNDTLKGGAGNDTLNGWDGTDVAVFSGDRNNYTFSLNGDTLTVTGNDGVDKVKNVEIFRFDNGDYTLSQLTSPPSTSTYSQYASRVTAYSSQYSTGGWSANQVLGASNTFGYGDISTAWTTSSANMGTQYIEVGFNAPVYADGVTIRETFNNGFVTKVQVVDINGNYHLVWSGTDTSPQGQPYDFKVNFAQTNYLVDKVRVEINTNHTTSWEEIDSIQLHGTTRISQYASQVTAYSSQYSSGGWSANQVLGASNTFGYGDISTAWTTSSPNMGTQYIEVNFDEAVYADGVTIRETFNNGFVTKVQVVDTNGNYHLVWSGTDTSPQGQPYDFKVNFAQTNYLVDKVRVEINTNHTSSWEEIDSIQLHGTRSPQASSIPVANSEPVVMAMALPEATITADITPEISTTQTITTPAYTLQILHASGLKGGTNSFNEAINFTSLVDVFEDEYSNSITLATGDNFIPGPTYYAGEDPAMREALMQVYEHLTGQQLSSLEEGAGRLDIALMNIIGFDASALGNQELALGTDIFSKQISVDVEGNTLSDIQWLGAQFPYLSANLDFSGDSSLSSLATTEILNHTHFQATPDELINGITPKKLAPATIIEEGTEKIGVVGVTTPLIKEITQAGGIEVIGGENTAQAIATSIQPTLDDLKAQGINKIVLLTNLQEFDLEKSLVPLLDGVDVVIAGSADQIFADTNDTLLDGDSIEANYPILSQDKAGNPTLIVSSDDYYRYLGRLVVDFDENGVILTENLDETINGAYATTKETVNQAWKGQDALAEGTKGAIAKQLIDSVKDLVQLKDSRIAGTTQVFLNGEEDDIRTQETNLGNLLADANLEAARAIDDTVMVAMINSGGIRDSFGEINSDTQEYLPPQGNDVSGKQVGDISQLDIETILRFNNQLVLLTVSAKELKSILEHGLSKMGSGAFPQVSGLQVNYDNTQPKGSRIRALSLVDEQGNVIDTIVKNDQMVGNVNRSIRMVTSEFLVNGGDGYDFPTMGENIVNLDVSEQEAIKTYLGNNPNYNQADTPAVEDLRIQFNHINRAPIEINLTNNKITENAKDNALIGNLSTLDANLDETHQYTLMDDAEGRFHLIDNQLRVKDGSLLDYETAISHEITVKTTDKEGATFEKTFTIELKDDIDPITGLSEDETINSGVGQQTLSGNGGNDIFQYQSWKSGGDIITDFNADNSNLGEHDLLDISRVYQTNNIEVGANAFEDYIAVSQIGSDTMIKYAPFAQFAPSYLLPLATLQNVDASMIDAKDFVF